MVEPLVRRRVDIPEKLAELLTRDSSALPIAADETSFKQFLRAM